jgi:vacuolar protein 8
MESPSPKVQCQAALALRNLASDERYQLDIVRARGLPPLLKLLKSSYLPLILSAVACIRNISIHPSNESPIIEAGFLIPLVDLLGSTDNEEIQCHAISTLRNLAASSDKNKELVLQAGAVSKCVELVLHVPLSVQSEMTAAIAVLALSDELKPRLLELGVFDVLIPLTESDSVEVQGNSAAALGNLSSKGEFRRWPPSSGNRIPIYHKKTIMFVEPGTNNRRKYGAWFKKIDTWYYDSANDGPAVGDYAIFLSHWTTPHGGIHGYLVRFLESGDATFQHIAIWTLLQLLESEDSRLVQKIRESSDVVSMVRSIAERSVESDREDDGEDGEGEVVGLAKRCAEVLGTSAGGGRGLVEG